MRKQDVYRSVGLLAKSLFMAAMLQRIAWSQEQLWVAYGQPPASPYSSFGYDVNSEGDVDGDGIWDVITGNKSYDASGAVGAAWVFSGKDGAVLHLVESFQGDGFGNAVAILPDIDVDGHAEFLVGDASDDTGSVNGGAVYVYSGSDATLKWSLFGTNSEAFGGEAALVADYDLDGLRDVAIGATSNGPGYVRVVSSATGTEITTLYSPSSAAGAFGRAISGKEDVNADGVVDLIVGDPYDYTNNYGAGAAFVFSGADWSVIHQVYQVAQQDAEFGYAVDGVGDLDGDGYAEFIAAAPYFDSASGAFNDDGKVWVYSGKDASAIHAYTGISAFGDTYLGFSVAGAGDVNGDGFPDYYIGEPGSYPDVVWLYSGRDGGLLYHLQGWGEFGSDCANIGDVDQDGRPDVAVGEPEDDTNGNKAGALFAYSGNDWFLDADNRTPAAYDTVTLTMGQTDAGKLAACFVVDVNGTPTFFLLALGACNGHGRFIVSGDVPSGLAGNTVGFLSFGIGVSGKVIDSAVEWIEFL